MMKNLLIGAALWGFFFAHSAFAQQTPNSVTGTNGGIWQGGSSVGQWFDWIPYAPGRIYAPYDPSLTYQQNLFMQFSLMFELRMWDGNNRYPCTVDLNGIVTCTSPSGTVHVRQLRFDNVQANHPFPETQTCNFFAGDKFFNLNQKNICADTGGTTGGPSSGPLLCMSEWLGGIQSESQHQFTSVQCSAADPDPEPEPDPEPDPDPTPDPEPDPTPNPGTPGGGGQPTSGTTSTTNGTSGTNQVNLVMDFKPVTERLDLLRADTKAHTNYLGQQIAAGTAATNSLKPLLEAIGIKTDGVAAAVKDGTADLKGELSSLNNTGKAIEGAIKDGNASLGEKLDGIKEGIDKLTEGEPIDGTAAGISVALPDYDAAVRSGIEQIQTTVNDYAQTSGINSLADPSAMTGMFAGAQSFSDVFDLARSGCSPIPFGSHGTFNVCGAAPTISMVLEIVIWALTALFIFHFVAGLITRERLS